MELQETLRLALEAVKINKLRSALTALGIIIGVAAIILLISIGSGLQKFVSQRFEKLGTNTIVVLPGKFQLRPQGGPPQSVNKLTFKLADRIEKEKGQAITEIAPFIQINVTASNGSKNKITQLVGTKSNYFDSFDIKAKVGRVFKENDNQASRKIAVMGETLAKNLYQNQNAVGKSTTISKRTFTVIGILEPQGNVGGIDIDNQVVIPINTARMLTGSDQVNSIFVKTRSTETIPQAKEQIKKILLRTLSEDDFSILTQEQLLTSVLQILSVITFALGGIAAISLIVGGVGISNIMLVSVTERTREIGLRKAVGARPKDILSQFLTEALILSILGGTVGLLVGFLGSIILSRFIQTAIPVWSVFLALGFSSLVGIIFGVAPAIRAARLEPIVALRHE